MGVNIIVLIALLGIASAAVPKHSGAKPNQLHQHQVHQTHQTHQHHHAEVDVLKQLSEIHPDGSYSYEYETGNGISASENGVGGINAQGQAQWTAPDGTAIDLSYVADENGYKPSGSHIHPIPEAILRAIQYIESHPPSEVEQHETLASHRRQ